MIVQTSQLTSFDMGKNTITVAVRMGHYNQTQSGAAAGFLQILCLEWKKKSEQPALLEHLAGRGFQLAARHKEDLVLVRADSEYVSRLTPTATPQP